MRISDLIAMCARNLTRRKFRTFLTVTGVVIGTCAIVVMISLGLGISESNRAMLESIGDLTLINIYNYNNTANPLTDESMEQIRALPGVDVATPIMELNLQSSTRLFAGRRDRYECWANITGMQPEAMEKLGYSLTAGEMLDSETGGKKIQVVFGSQAAYEFQDTKKRWPNNRINIWEVPEGETPPDPFFPPMETDITLRLDPVKMDGKPLDISLEVTGILEGDWRRGGETMYGIVMSIEDMKRVKAEYEKANGIRKDRNAAEEGYTNARVKCTDINLVESVETAIHDLGFTETSSWEQERKSMQESAQQIQLILGILGGVSLFVAAISITNTMIMSVYERTREIGVMKVLGCVLGNIRAVFLLEAGLIGFMGGILGNGFSWLLSWALNKFGGSIGEVLGLGGRYYGGEDVVQKLSVIPPWLMLLGLVFATAIGLVSGIMPAMRAVKISALEAIRQE